MTLHDPIAAPGTSANVEQLLAGGGEMGKFIREKDWSQTPLGPIESWPQSLRTTVSLCLASNFPISIAWGPGRTQIYNDGYWPICGAKHPRSMGQDFKECWASAWPAIGDAFERGCAGETAFLVNERMFLDRNGYLEETFFTFSFSPIRDESGGVGGLFHPVIEMTQQSLAERRLKVLRELADHTAEARSVVATCDRIAQALGAHALDVPFALLYLVDADASRATLAGRAGLPSGSPVSPEAVDLTASSQRCWPLAEAVLDRKVVQVDDLERQCGPLTCGPYPESPRTAFVLPISISGLRHPIGVLVAGVSARRALDDAYSTFYLLLRDAVANALTGARAYEEERKRAEALAELDRAKTAFFSNVSHEFRTPLTLMLGPLEDTLAQADDLPAEHRERLDVAHRNALRLLKLVNTLLDFSRIEAGRIQAAYEPTDLAAFTAELASVFRSAIERAGLKLVVDCPPLPEGVPAYVDREMWEKIVLNLLSNAFKFTFEGEIDVELRCDGERIALTVRDTGVGIPADELPRIFERFHRIRNARGRSFEGSGIGLALVQELVKLHGGTVSVESEPGRGSAFIVSVPVGAAHLPADRIGAARTLAPTGVRGEAYVEEALRWLPEEDAAPGDRRPERAGGTMPEALQPRLRTPATPAAGPARILLADDNADMREYVSRLLGRGYDVVAVGDGEAALRAARDAPFDLVLADVMMPGLDGFGLLRELRADERLKTVPVILLSARAGEEARVEGMQAGADDYLTKPFSANELLARVEAHIVLKQTRDELNRQLGGRVAQQHELFRFTDRLSRARTWADIYEATLDAVHATLGAERASVLLFDEQRTMRFRAWRGLSAAYRQAVDGHSPWSYGAVDPSPIYIENVADAPLDEELRAVVVGEGIAALAFVPLTYLGELLGKFMLYYDTPRRFTLEERQLAQTIAAQLAFGIARARGEEALRASERRFKDMADTAPAMLWVTDQDHQCIFLSRGWYEYTGQMEGGTWAWTGPRWSTQTTGSWQPGRSWRPPSARSRSRSTTVCAQQLASIAG